MHVGCARWGCKDPEESHLDIIDDKQCKLCYFTPGRYDAEDNEEDFEKETIACCYCDKHASDIVTNNPNRKEKAKCNYDGCTDKVVNDRGLCQKHQDLHDKKPPPSKKQPSPNSTINRRARKIPINKKSTDSIQSRRRKKAPAGVFGDSSKKKAKIEFARENTIQYPLMGRSSATLALSEDVQVPQVERRQVNSMGAASASITTNNSQSSQCPKYCKK